MLKAVKENGQDRISLELPDGTPLHIFEQALNALLSGPRPPLQDVAEQAREREADENRHFIHSLLHILDMPFGRIGTCHADVLKKSEKQIAELRVTVERLRLVVRETQPMVFTPDVAGDIACLNHVCGMLREYREMAARQKRKR